jgi:LacI family transcriptional regulator
MTGVYRDDMSDRSSPLPAPATIRDVARVAKVSMTTVSHALSNKRPVRPETAARIQAAIDLLGYVPYSAARNLQAGRTFMLGLVVPDVSDPFFGQLAVGAERYADAHGFGVVISSTIGTPHKDARYFNLLRSRSIDGLIYVAGDSRRDPELTELAKNYPVVLADEWSEGLANIPLVSADHRLGGRLAGEHLKSLEHERVAVITGPRGLRTTEDRLSGFLELYPDARVVDGNFSEEVGYHRAAKLLGLPKPPTAIFASNDNAAFGVIDCAKDRGIAVPTELSVVGFDDIPIARRLTPPLTTVRQPIGAIGELATEQLIKMLSGAAVPMLELCRVELVVRDSTTSAPSPRSGKEQNP